MRILRSTAIIGATALALTMVSMGSALADPASTPATTSIVAVGSDTIQYVADSFSTSYNGSSPAPANPFYSWDATNPTTGLPGDTIKTKNDANCSITRPNGSGAGIAQLQAQIKTTGGTEYCVDLARSSRNIQASDGAGLISVLFAHDLITYAINSGGHGVTNLTDADLTAIFECNDTALGGTGHPVTWNEVGGTSTDAIVPVLPQSSSGTRSQWLLDIGLTNTTIGSCVVNGTFGGNPIEENEGTNAVYTATGNPTGYQDALAIYSGGVYLCQTTTSNCGTINTAQGNLKIEDIDGKAPLTTTTPVTLNIGTKTPFPPTYIRGLYFVAKNGGTATAPKVPTPTTANPWPIDLTKFLGNGNNTGYICSTAAATIVKSYGFVPQTGTLCGTLTGQ